QDIVCTVNLFHNCAAHSCKITKTRVVRQERHATSRKENEIIHMERPNDLVLNLAQLRSASLIQ
ncbi:hypothetical protein B0H21DRAFT_662789, partial [Amylocystis lapponica]